MQISIYYPTKNLNILKSTIVALIVRGLKCVDNSIGCAQTQTQTQEHIL